ncbi:MAG: PrsW family glutamic-type intramembrane protease [Deltaproteobacteria bacterium]|jgi:RsiW-degrading membrane proteinase PrsW (M82 family)
MTKEEIGPLSNGLSHRTTLWRQVLLGGMGFYFIGLSVLILTGNPNVFPTVVMIGSFLVPVTYVAFFYDRRHLSRLTLPTTAMAFLYGGVMGLFAAALLEPLFVGRLDFFSAFEVGLIEEFAKILGVLFIARRHRHDSEMDGLILGAAAGMGFAALESNGYAFVAFLTSGGSLSVTVFVTLLRGILAPVGHGTWTAILASVLFRESEAGRFRINHKVIGAYLTASALHGLWDGLPSAISRIFAPGLDVFLGQALVGGIGLVILWKRWHEAKRLQVENSGLVS